MALSFMRPPRRNENQRDAVKPSPMGSQRGICRVGERAKGGGVFPYSFTWLNIQKLKPKYRGRGRSNYSSQKSLKMIMTPPDFPTTKRQYRHQGNPLKRTQSQRPNIQYLQIIRPRSHVSLLRNATEPMQNNRHPSNHANLPRARAPKGKQQGSGNLNVRKELAV